MICYEKLFELMKDKGKTKKDIRDGKIIGQETLRKLRNGTGIYEDYNFYTGKKTENDECETKPKKRLSSIDTKSIEALCVWLQCQPSDIMEYISNTWDNADRLCEALKCTKDELPDRVPMESIE